MSTSNFVIMFIDVVGSTALKYREDAATVAAMIDALYEIVRRQLEHTSPFKKYLGDGVMVWRRGLTKANCTQTVVDALEILREVELLNLQFRFPPIDLRIGIASGSCHQVADAEVSGRPADLAARLCSEADVNTVLMDQITAEKADFATGKLRNVHKQPCTRRLSLKGIPLQVPASQSPAESFYFVEPVRLFNDRYRVRPTERTNGSPRNGLISLYPGRSAVIAEFSVARLAQLAAAVPGNRIVVAGRTLIHWANEKERLIAASKRGIRFLFLLGPPPETGSAADMIDRAQMKAILRDLPDARSTLESLEAANPHRFEVQTVPGPIIDGVVSGYFDGPLLTNGRPNPRGDNGQRGPVFLAFKDINAGQGEHKATLVLGCTHVTPPGDDCQADCMAHGLRHRTLTLSKEVKEAS